MTTWQARAITFDPPVLYTTAREDVTIALDMTALLVNGGAPSLPQCVLIRQDTKATVALSDTPTVSTNTVQQRLRGLAEGVLYKLYVSVLTSSQRREAELNVDVALD
jgi:hypothetical protein